MEISEQNEVLTEHLHFLQETLQKMARIQPCDSFAMPPPSALRTPASAVPTAAGVKRGLEGEHADSPRPCARPAPGPPARALTAGGSPFVWPPQPLSDGQPGGRFAVAFIGFCMARRLLAYASLTVASLFWIQLYTHGFKTHVSLTSNRRQFIRKSFGSDANPSTWRPIYLPSGRHFDGPEPRCLALLFSVLSKINAGVSWRVWPFVFGRRLHFIASCFEQWCSML